MRRTEPPSVLLVDDATDEREMYAEFLRSSGYETLQARSAAEAWRLVLDERPSVVVTDVMMRGEGDGFTLTRDLKRDERTRGIPVVILTGRAFDADREQAAQAGCDLFLTKPCLPDELAASLQRLLADRNLQKVRGRPARAPVPPAARPRQKNQTS